MDRRMVALLMIVLLDGMGLGLTWPIMPDLLRSVGGAASLEWSLGAFMALYAAMQFLCAPLLGALSDRIGRRPVLLIALIGAAADYLFMALAPSLALLFVGRAIAGATSASMAVASAYVADITPEERRARNFGQLSAAMGLGFVAGPLLGGLIGSHWLRAPFLVAAVLNAANLTLVWFWLREARKPDAQAEGVSLNPFAPLRWAFTFPRLAPLIGAFLIIALIGQIGGALWVVHGEDRYGWGLATVGLSLAGFGLFHALAQAFVAGPLSERWGERRAMLVGMAADGAAYVAVGFATAGWVAFALLPLFCLGGVGAPALQALISAEGDEDSQGRAQGLLASLTSLASVIGPVVITTGYFATRAVWPGAMWLAGAALYLLCLPLVLRARARAVAA